MIKRLIQVAVLAVGFSAVFAWANVDETRTVTEVKDVETLNDDLSKYSGKVVRVSGKIEERIDSSSVVLESGGIFNDEIIVIGGPNLKGTKINALKENAKVVVTGTVVMKPLADFRREYNWTLTPQLDGEFSDTKAFLVADEITVVRK